MPVIGDSAELGRVFIIEDRGNYSKDDIISIQWSNVDNVIFVTVNNVLVTSGDTLTKLSSDDLSDNSQWWSRVDNGFQTTITESGLTYKVTFSTNPSFPYYSELRTELITDPPEDVRDISLRFVSSLHLLVLLLLMEL